MKKQKEVRSLLRISADQYPKGLPGKRLPEIGSQLYISMNKRPIVTEHVHAMSFYGENDMYQAWTSFVKCDDNKMYFIGVMGNPSEMKNKEIVWLESLPAANVAYNEKVTVAKTIHKKAGFREVGDHWPLSNLITYHTTEQLKEILSSDLTEEFKHKLKVMHEKKSQTDMFNQ